MLKQILNDLRIMLSDKLLHKAFKVLPDDGKEKLRLAMLMQAYLKPRQEEQK